MPEPAKRTPKLRGRRPGRPKKDDPKRIPLGLRTTKQFREKLEEAADETGRSLSQEVEFRLEMSLDRDAWGGPHIEPILKALALTARNIMAQTNASPAEDYATSVAIKSAFERVIESRLARPETDEVKNWRQSLESIAEKKYEINQLACDLMREILESESFKNRDKSSLAELLAKKKKAIFNPYIPSALHLPDLPDIKDGTGFFGLSALTEEEKQLRSYGYLFKALEKTPDISIEEISICLSGIKEFGGAFSVPKFQELARLLEELNNLEKESGSLGNEIINQSNMAKDMGLKVAKGIED